MQSIEYKRKEAISEIYLILAEFYKFPEEQFYKELSQGIIEDKLKEFFQIAKYNYPNYSISNVYSSFHEMRGNYMNCFDGTNHNFAPPIESVYKVWTTDPSADMAMAREKGYLYGDSALHMRHLFDYFQIDIPENYKNKPDHLTLLLEFVVFLNNEKSEEEVYQFLKDHFDWLDDFIIELSKIENSNFYVGITLLASEAIKSELKWLENKLNISGYWNEGKE